MCRRADPDTDKHPNGDAYLYSDRHEYTDGNTYTDADLCDYGRIDWRSRGASQQFNGYGNGYDLSISGSDYDHRKSKLVRIDQ